MRTGLPGTGCAAEKAGADLTVLSNTWVDTMNNNNTAVPLFSATSRLLLGCSLAGLAPVTAATEGGASMYPMGAENYLSGAMPPPGLYGTVYAQHYRADSLRGNDGRELPLDFSLRANVIAPRIVWVTERTVLGGSLAFHAIVPLVDLKVSLDGNSQRKRELGDITFGPGLGYHYSEKFHAAYGVDFFAPTGRFDRDDGLHGERVEDNKGRAFAIGPSIKYSNPRGWFVTAKWQQESAVRNRAEGDAYWLKLVFPF